MKSLRPIILSAIGPLMVLSLAMVPADKKTYIIKYRLPQENDTWSNVITESVTALDMAAAKAKIMETHPKAQIISVTEDKK